MANPVADCRTTVELDRTVIPRQRRIAPGLASQAAAGQPVPVPAMALVLAADGSRTCDLVVQGREVRRDGRPGEAAGL